MRATPQARLLVAAVDFVDRYWGPVIVGVIVVLEAFVFGPRQQQEAMLIAGIVGAAVFVAWLVAGSD